jgi:hypothetical protein
VTQKKTTKPKEKPNLLTWLLQKDKRDEKKGRVEVE